MPVLNIPEGTTTLTLLDGLETVEYVKELGWAKFHTNYLSKLVATERFPEPFITVGGRKAWLQSDVDHWFAHRADEDRQKAIQAALRVTAGMDEQQLQEYLHEVEKLARSAQHQVQTVQ